MNNLKEYREKNELSVKRLANIFKVPQSTIIAWENGTKDPSMMQLQSLSYLYDCSFDDLFPYTKPDPYEFGVRKSAVFKKYQKRCNKIIISIILSITIIALLIVLMVNLTPQIHAKWHAQRYFDEMKEYCYKETNEEYGTIVEYANKNSDLDEDKYCKGVAVVTYDMEYIIYFHYGKMRAMIDIHKNLKLTLEATITVNSTTIPMEIGDYQNVYYLIVYESNEPGLKKIVDQYKISKGITA